MLLSAKEMTASTYSHRPTIGQYITHLSLILLLLLFSKQSLAELPLFSAEYKLTRGAIPIATVKLSLQRHETGFLLESRTEPVVPLSWIRQDLVIEQSYWHYHEQSLRPTHYRYRRSNRNSFREVTIDFNWLDKKLITTTNGDSWSMALNEETVDKALVQLALMKDLSKGKAENSYSVADGGRPKNYQFSEMGEEILTSKLGRMKTLKIARKKSGKAPDAILWMAPKLNFLPIRIDKIRDGAVYSMLITKLTVLNPKDH